MSHRLAHVCVLALMIAALVPVPGPGAQVFGTDVTYTMGADFDLGTLVSVNHDAPNDDQLQLDSPTEPFPFINVAASGRGTVVRINTDTGDIVGEYRTAPDGYGLDPSRTTVDLFGNVWTANRGEVSEIDNVPHGSAVKIGLIVGGTRVDPTGAADPNGGYLAPPFGYNTCVDRDNDGLIRTSAGLFDVLDWVDATDGSGGDVGLVNDAEDECILIYQRLPNAEQARHVSVDADNNVWVGGFPFELRFFHKLSGTTGAILDSFDANTIGCGGYGGLVDGSGVLWSIGWGWGEGPLLRYDPATGQGTCVNTFGGYGLGIDTNGYVWASLWENGIAKVSPAGVLEPGFPKSTSPSSSTPTATANPLVVTLAPELAVFALQAEPPAETPTFWVAPADEWVASMSPWPPGAAISLSIEDGGGVVYSDSQTADGDGNFHFGFWDVFDLHAGHVVTVSDGTTTKTHTVTSLAVDGMSVAADTVYGRADPGTSVDVWVHGDGNVTPVADGSGSWTADFSGTTDLTYLSDGGSAQYDDDGDATGVWWTAPRFQVSPDDDWVQSSGTWPSGTTISLTVADGTGDVYSDSQTADPYGRFEFGLGEVFDLQRGHLVTVSDGTNTKIHTVAHLFADGVDVTADDVFGRADPGTSVDVWVHGDGNLTTTADGSGNWTADFSGMADLTYLSDGGSQQFDEDGDSTGDWWASPHFQVAPDDNWVQASGPWTPGAVITMEIEDGSGIIYADSQTADSNGHFNFGDLGGFDLQRGHVVTVSDGTTTKTHTVIDLYVDGIDATADTVFGRGEPNIDVDVWVHGDGNLTTAADGSGNWVADFSGMADLTYRSDGGSQQSDEDGDSTGVWWASPAIQVQPNQDWIGSWTRWPANTTIAITIDDDANPENGTLYSSSVTTNQWGDFGLGLQGVFDVERGQYVTAADATTTKTHQVLDLYITDLDSDNDVVSGTAAPNSEVEVQVHGPDHAWRVVTADASGNWSADFATVTGQGDGTAAVRFTSDVSAHQFDDQGDVTWVNWQVPAFRVNPDQDRVWGSTWPANSPVTVTVGSSSVWSGTTNQWGDFDTGGFELDLVPNQVVTVTAGVWTKTHSITNVDVIDIDPTADMIHGTADPGADVEVSVYRFQDGSVRWVIADSSGYWSADFSLAAQDQPAFDITDTTPVEVAEYDDDADATQRRFGPPEQANRGVAVTPADNHVWVASSGIGAVTRLDNDGNVVKLIQTGIEPTGVAVDAAGKVWVTNIGSDNTVRIDPSAGSDGLGVIDMTVELGPGAAPYNYSDMTGAVVVGSTSPQGLWTVIQDSGQPGFEWGRIAWNSEPEGSEPSGTEIVVEARTADSEAGLGGKTFAEVANGELFSSFGQFIEVRVTLKASTSGVSPVLSDIRVQPALIEIDLDIKPGSDPNSINIKRTTGVVPVAVLGRDDFAVSSIDVTTLRFGRGMAEPDHDLLDPDVYADHMQDVNEDGFTDLVSHYRIGDIGLMSGDTEACLVGATLTGIPIQGCDAVRIIGKS